MGRLFWIICVGRNVIMSFYKTEVTRPIEEKVDVMAKAESRMMWPGTKECWQLLEAGRARETDPLLEPAEGSTQLTP